jgi:tripartite-type tricarboxylate transporter receptor subunit TctC
MTRATASRAAAPAASSDTTDAPDALRSSRRRALAAGAARAADPARPIEWVVGYAAGGGSDVVARILAEPLSKSLGQPIVITNKPGAATNIAADYAARSKDTGNLLFSADFATLAANPALFRKLSYDAEKDFAPVGLLVRFPLILVVGNQVPARDWKGFAAWAKAQPGSVTYASAGPGSPHHLAMELLRDRAGLDMTHVPYRGAAPAMVDLMGGQVPCMFVDSASGYQYIASGKFRAIGVASLQRAPTMPEIPTLAEQGLKDFEASAWQGLVAPAATPPATVARFSQALVEALNSAPVRARLQALGVEPLPGTPAQMSAFAKRERERWGTLIRARDIHVD